MDDTLAPAAPPDSFRSLSHHPQSLVRLQTVLDSSDLTLLGVALREVVEEIRVDPKAAAQLRRGACLVTERCGATDSRYQQARRELLRQVKRSRVRFHPKSVLPTLVSSPQSAAPVLVSELEIIVRRLVSVVASPTMPTAIADACREWRDACDDVLVECRSIEAAGCYLLWKSCPEPGADADAKVDADAIVEHLRWLKGAADQRQAVFAAAELLVNEHIASAAPKPYLIAAGMSQPTADAEKNEQFGRAMLLLSRGGRQNVFRALWNRGSLTYAAIDDIRGNRPTTSDAPRRFVDRLAEVFDEHADLGIKIFKEAGGIRIER